MCYSTFADYSKKMVHWTIDTTFPSSPTIAAVSTFAGWYSHRWIQAYGPHYLNSWTIEASGWLGYLIIPVTTPSITPSIAYGISIVATCATSFTLNQISKAVFKIHPPPLPAAETPTPLSLDFAPYDSTPSEIPSTPMLEWLSPEADTVVPREVVEVPREAIQASGEIVEELREVDEESSDDWVLPWDPYVRSRELLNMPYEPKYTIEKLYEQFPIHEPVPIYEQYLARQAMAKKSAPKRFPVLALEFIMSLFSCMPKFPGKPNRLTK